MKNVPISLSEAAGHIDWQDFFSMWDIAPSLAQIAGIRGCGHCQAQWLAAQPQALRTEASSAMQLLKEARVAIDRLIRDTSADCLHVESVELPSGTLLRATLNNEIEKIAAQFDQVLPEKAKLYRTLANCLLKAAVETAYLRILPTAGTTELLSETDGENCTYMPMAAKRHVHTADRQLAELANQTFPPCQMSVLALVSNRQLTYIEN